MRSSIACARCRRSKVKCINAGINTTCRACEASGRECTYPAPAGTSGVKRDHAGGSADYPGKDGPSGETPKRHRRKKSATLTYGTLSGPHKEIPRAFVDALDSSLLTPKVWTELFDIFQQHYSTDLPFLHPPTFLRPLRQTSFAQNTPPEFSHGHHSSPQPPASPLLLLALLSLTARFHARLTAHHSPPSSRRPTNPLVASEFYASACRARLAGPSGDSLACPSLERIQALLMLGMHEWGMCRGVKAWIYVGIAIRMAQSMGLQFDQTPDPESLAQSSTLGAIPSLNETAFSDVGSKYDEMIPGKTFVEQEVRRRTFWSCFMMDRFLSGGVCRPAILNVKDFKIQLPGSERAFLFGESVRTGYLGDDGEDQLGATEAQNQRGGSLFCTDRSRGPATPDTTYGRSGSGREDTSIEKEESGRWEIGADEGVLSRVVRIMEIWGRVAKWSCYGGRSTESHPPWQRETTIHHLRSLLADFQAALPRHLTFTPANLSAHITSRTSTPYTLMHTIYFLCVIILHREYLPFVPLGCTKAQGPLDSPRYPVEEYDVPPSWWESSANECFKAARDIMDLVRVCKDWGVLVETPIVGFAIYTVAVLGEFCMNFPHMDPEGYMSSCSASSIEASPSANATMSARNYGGAQETRRAVEMIGRMRSRLKMADGWFRTIKRLHCHFARVRKEYEQRSEVLSHPSEPETDSSGRQPQQATPSSTEYKLLEMTLREFGTLDDEDPDVMDVDDREGGKDGSDADQGSGSDAASTAVKSEIIEGARENSIDSAAARRDRWIAINSVASAAAAGQHPDSMLLSNGHNVYQPSEGYSVPGPSSSYRPQDRYPIETNTTSYARPAPPPVTAPTTANSSPTATTAAGTQTFMSPNSNSAHSTSTTSLSVATTTHSPYNQHPSITTISSSSRPLTLPMPPTSAAMQTLPPLKQQQLTPLAATEGTEQHVWGYPEKAAAVAMSREEWLQGLETRFSGDDVLAFVSGSGWEEWGSGGGGKGAGMNHSGVEMGMGMGMGSTVGAGWLRMIWTS